MTTKMIRTESIDATNGIHLAYISVNEIHYKGEIKVVYKVDSDGFFSLANDAKQIIAETGHKISTIKSLIKANIYT